MSQRRPESSIGLVVGWDQPMGTFFAFSDDDEGTFDTIETVGALAVYVEKEFGVKLAREMLGLLHMDRDSGVMNEGIEYL